MKALVYEKAHALKDFAIVLADIPEPSVRDQDILVEVRAIGVNPGEAQIRSSRSAEPGGRVLLGYEFAGVVVEVGADVQPFKPGDRVFGTGSPARDGAWAERVAIDHRSVSHIPDQLSFEDAASLPIGSLTAWEALFRDQDRLPDGVDLVLVLGGAGAVGSLGTQLLKATSGATVIGTGSRPESRAWCSEMCADLVLDHAGDIQEQLTGAGIRQVDMVLATAKSAESVDWIAEVLRPFGHFAVVDGGSGLDVTRLMSKSISLHQEMVFSRILHGSAPERQSAILDRVSRLVLDGSLRPITTARLKGLTVETMRAAHEALETKRTIGKVVIAIN